MVAILRTNRFLIFVLILAFFVRLPFLFLARPGAFPDEAHIFERIYISTLERVKPDALGGYSKYKVNNEYHYPPLYFFVNSLQLEAILRLQGSDLSITNVFLKYIYIFRFESFIFSLITIIISWRILIKITSVENAKLAIIFFTFLPTQSVFSNALNGYNIALFFIFLAILLSYDKAKDFFAVSKVGILVGISLLVHIVNVLLVPSLFFYFLIMLGKNKIKLLFVFLILVLLFGGWWYLLNFLKYGTYTDPAFSSANAGPNYNRPFSIPNYTQTILIETAKTFIFTAGKTNNLRFVDSLYQPFLLLAIAVSYGLFKCFKGFKVRIKSLWLILFLVFILNLALFIWMNFVGGVAPQGRYFFPSLLFISLLVGIGLNKVFSGPFVKILPIVLLSFLLLYNFIGAQCMFELYYRSFFAGERFLCFNFY